MATQYHVFLSHHFADKPAVEELAHRLVQDGLEPWLDSWNLIPGEPMQEAVEKALDQSDSVAIFIGPSGIGPWQNEEMRAAIRRQVQERRASEHPFRVIPVLLPGATRGERSQLPAFLVENPWVEFRRTLDDDDAFHRLVAGIRGRAPGRPLGLAGFESQCPYRGLPFFDVEHSEFFFGREPLIGWLLDALRRETRFLAIVGPSGSGKSSLMRAGLIASLKHGEIEGSADWPIATFRPGTNPLETLAVAVAGSTRIAESALGLRDLIQEMGTDERILHLNVAMVLSKEPSDKRMVVCIDQFEEIFTLCRDDRMRNAFIANLLYASSVAGGRTVVILSMRADFYGRCATYPALAAALSDSQILVGPMTEDELKRAIELPAQLVGIELEGGLSERLINDVEDQVGGLPLLQHALLELWHHRQGRRLTHAAYESVGGVEGALEQRAETVYQHLSPEEQALCKRIFLRLIQPGEGDETNKRQAPLNELVPMDYKSETIEYIIQTLSGPNARLITTVGVGDKCFVEVSHEALLRGWSRLRSWIAENRESLRIRRRISDAAREWNASQEDPSYLFRGARMLEANEWAGMHPDELTQLERSFIDAGLAERERSARKEIEHQLREAELEAEHRQAGRLRRLATGLAISVAAAAILAITALVARGSAVQQSNALATAQVQAEQARVTAVAEAQARATAQFQAEQLHVLAVGEAQARSTAEADALHDRDRAVEAHSTAEAARSAAEEAERRTNGLKLTFASQDVLEVNRELALLLAIEAAQRSPSTEAAGALRQAMAQRGRSIRLLAGHTAPLRDLAWDPNGLRVATAAEDGITLIFDSEAGDLLQSLTGHSDVVTSVAWNPAGSRLATSSYDGTGIVADPVSGRTLHVLRGHSGRVSGIEWDPDGVRLLTVSDDGVGRIWNSQTGVELTTLEGHTAAVLSGEWSPDGSRIVTSSQDNTARIWNSDSGELAFVLSGHTDHVFYAFWNNAGDRIVTAGRDNTARVWDAANGQELAILRGHTEPVRTIGWSPDGKRILTGSRDGTARIWNAATGEELALLKGHIGAIADVAWNPTGTLATTASADGTVCLWDSTTGKLFATLTGHSSGVTLLEWSPNGLWLVTGGRDGTARSWSLYASNSLIDPSALTAAVTDASWSPATQADPSGELIATASSDGTVRVWDAASGTLQHVLDEHGGTVLTVAWEPGPLTGEHGPRLVTGSADGNARVWDGETGQLLAVFVEHRATVAVANWDPVGQRIVTAGSDATPKVWDPMTGALLVDLVGHERRVLDAQWSPDGSWIATASADGTARLWDATTGEMMQTLVGHSNRVLRVSWSSDGSRLATGSADGTARIWDTSNGQELATLSGHSTDVVDIAWRSDDQLLATGSLDMTARVWDANTYQLRSNLTAHRNWIVTVGWSPDNSSLLTASRDHTARIWDAASGQELAVLKSHDDTLTSASWSHDGSKILTSSLDGTAQLYVVGLQELLDQACDTIVRNMSEDEWAHYLGTEAYHETCPGQPVPGRDFFQID